MAASFFPVRRRFPGLCAAPSSLQRGRRPPCRPRAPATLFRRESARFGIASEFESQRLRRREQIVLKRGPPLGPDNPALVNVERPGDLDLNRVGALRWRAEVLGDEAAGERLVAADAVPARLRLDSRMSTIPRAALAP